MDCGSLWTPLLSCYLYEKDSVPGNSNETMDSDFNPESAAPVGKTNSIPELAEPDSTISPDVEINFDKESVVDSASSENFNEAAYSN